MRIWSDDDYARFDDGDDHDADEREHFVSQLDAVTVILLLLVAVLGLLTVAAQVGMWIGRNI